MNNHELWVLLYFSLFKMVVTDKFLKWNNMAQSNEKSAPTYNCVLIKLD